MTIKARLTLAVVLLLAVAAAILGSIAIASARDSMIDRVDKQLATIARRPPRGVGPGGPLGRGLGGGPPPDGGGPPQAGAPRRGRRGTLPPGSPLRRGRGGAARPGRGLRGIPALPGTTPQGAADFQETAELLYSPSGRRLLASPSGFPSAPDPLPKLPPIGGAEGQGLIGHARTLPARGGSFDYRVLAV